MGKYKTLLINIGLFTLNTISTKLITFLLVPLYTFFLTTKDYGITDMSLTVVSLVAPIVTLSIGDAVTRYIIDDFDDRKRYITLGFWVTVFGCVVMFLLLPILELPMFGGLGRYKYLYICYFISSSFNGFMANVARGLNYIKLITWVSIVSSIVSASTAGILIGLCGWKVNGYFVSLILGGTVSVVLYLICGKMWRYIQIPRDGKDRSYLRAMLRYSIPLMPNSIFWWMGTSVNRFFITSMLGIGASGLFAAASKIPNMMNLVSSTFWQAWSLSAFQQYKQEDTDRFYSNVFVVFRSFCFIAASVLILVSPWLASILLQKEFYNAWYIIPILVLGFLLNVFAGFYGTVFTAGMKTKYLLTSTMSAAVVVVVLTWVLIPPLGLQGAAWAIVGSNLVMYLMRVFDSRKFIAIKVNWTTTIINFMLIILQVFIMALQQKTYSLFSTVILFVVVLLSLFELYPFIRNIIHLRKGGNE